MGSPSDASHQCTCYRHTHTYINDESIHVFKADNLLFQTLIPTLDNLTNTQSELQWLVAIEAAIELFASIKESARVMHWQLVSTLCVWDRISTTESITLLLTHRVNGFYIPRQVRVSWHLTFMVNDEANNKTFVVSKAYRFEDPWEVPSGHKPEQWVERRMQVRKDACQRAVTRERDVWLNDWVRRHEIYHVVPPDVTQIDSYPFLINIHIIEYDCQINPSLWKRIARWLIIYNSSSKLVINK